MGDDELEEHEGIFFFLGSYITDRYHIQLSSYQGEYSKILYSMGTCGFNPAGKFFYGI